MVEDLLGIGLTHIHDRQETQVPVNDQTGPEATKGRERLALTGNL